MKTLYLVRGLPNAGKTTLAGELSEHTVAADDYQVDERGEYAFDPARLASCHAECLDQVEIWLASGVDSVAVHNTFTKNWEMEPYVQMAREHGYRLVVITVERSHGGDNGHGVQPETIAAMADRWEGFENE